ncbi:MAG TPA: AraC family transcriptional regulator [Gemmatimonadaceae bacterium]|nr:AraC family transcriptional regulator [Gemmatimonadaceae bacterium]
MTEPRTGSADWTGAIPLVVAHAKRERARALVRNAFPRRKGRLVFARSAAEVDEVLRTSLVDAVVVDIGAAQEEAWKVSALAGDHPTAAFFAVTPLRVGDAPALADCAHRDFAGVLIEGVDDAVARTIVMRAAFSTRFARALNDPPPSLSLSSALQRSVWRLVIEHAGRPVRTSALAAALGMTREHLSRSFSANGSPNLKRVIDLVRVIAAAELAKNPGLDLRDVSSVLGFASPSHLSTTAMRIAGTKPASLTRLRTIDILERFSRGNGRSRR